MKPRVLCAALSSEAGPHLELLPEKGFEVGIVDPALDLTVPKVLIEALQGYQAVFAGSEPYTPEVIAGCPELRVIARAGVGFDAVDLPACDQHGVVVATSPGVNHEAVAEQTIALLVSLARAVPLRDRQVRQGVWERMSTPRIAGRVMGVVGMGRIGRAVASRANGLGMSVLAVDPFLSAEAAAELNVQVVELPQLLAESDYVSLHAPVDEQSYHMINDDSIGQMKSDACLINTARGPLVDESALIRALQDGRLRGAGLDVFEEEPLPTDSPLISLDNVVLSGHIAGLDDESHRDTYLMSVDTVVQLRDGSWPADRIQNLQGVTDWSWDRS